VDPVRLARSSALHLRARAFVSAFARGEAPPEPFDALACDLARFQADAVPGYARLCRARGVAPGALSRAGEIPAVPTDAFKVTRVATFDEADATAVFRTSGTTSATSAMAASTETATETATPPPSRAARGVHAMRDVTTYDAAALAFGRAWLARDLPVPVPVVVVAPPPDAMPDSSLVHMCAVFAEAFGDGSPPDRTFVVQGDVVDLSTFDERVARADAQGLPVLVLGTSFAFVHLLDALGDDTFRLPAGSRVMQTGGYKGKSREVPKAELRRGLARAFRVGERAIVAEYGMTELSSQFYERTLFDPRSPSDVLAEPPWARVVPVDPDTLAPVPDGQLGIAKVLDLMNVDSAVAVLTQDLVKRVPGGFELAGRLPGAPPRGCSIAIDEILGAS
jgi:hypothetical protein